MAMQPLADLPTATSKLVDSAAGLQSVMDNLVAACATAVIRTDSYEKGKGCAEAALAGGFKSLEFTLSIPGCHDLITEYSSRPGLLVGIGTVFTPEEAEAGVRAGAQFVISPCLCPDV